MFENLLESRPGRERSLGQICSSAAIHAALVAAAIVLTRNAVAATADDPPTTVSFLRTPPPPPTPAHRPPPASATAQPAVHGFQALVPPKVMPTQIPPVDLDGTFDARDYTRQGVLGGRADGVTGGVPSVAEATAGETYQSLDVDQPAQLERGADPKYPAALRISGLNGSVAIEFVVSARGRAEENTLKVVRSSDPRFDDAAKDAVARSTYRPAMLRGVAVRQLVIQTVVFTITP